MIEMMSRYVTLCHAMSAQPGEYGLWAEIMLNVRNFYTI